MSLDDDDGDEPMDTQGMEPESPTGADPGDDDDAYDDGDGAVAAGGGIAKVISAARGTRPISDALKAKWKELAAKSKPANPDDDPEERLLDEPPDTTTQASAAAASPSPGKEAAATSTPVAPAAPPAPSLDPEVTRLREEHTAKLAELFEREQALAERERGGDWERLRAEYSDKGAPAIVEVIKKLAGITGDGDDLLSEVADVVTMLSASVLKVDVPQAMRDKIDSKLARRGLALTKEQLRREAEEQRKAQERAAEKQNVARVKTFLANEVGKAKDMFPSLATVEDPGHAVFALMDGQHKIDGTRYEWSDVAKRLDSILANNPWLAAQSTPADDIMDVAVHQRKTRGVALSWEDAAKIANDFLKSQATAYVEKRKHLLSASPAKAGDGKGGKPNAQQGKPSGSQAHAPKPTDTPAPEPHPTKGKWDPEEHRRNTMRKHRALFKQQADG